MSDEERSKLIACARSLLGNTQGFDSIYEITEDSEGRIQVEGWPGCHIPLALAEIEFLVHICRRRCGDDTLKMWGRFNGQMVEINPDAARTAFIDAAVVNAQYPVDAQEAAASSTLKPVLAELLVHWALVWNALVEKAQSEYQASPEYAESVRKYELTLKNKQAQIDHLLAEFEKFDGSDTDAVLKWVASFAAINDDRGLKFDTTYLYNKFTEMGYVRNAHVQDRAARTNLGSEEAAEYVIGQAMDHLHRGMPMNPILQDFAQKALDIDPDGHQ